MKSYQSEKNLYKSIFQPLEASDDLTEAVLEKFSVYIDNYDEDYLYNYKFIVSHIKEFLSVCSKAENLIKKAKKIKKALLNDKNLMIFFQAIKKYQHISLTITLNNAIELNFIKGDEKKEIIEIKEIGVPSKKSLKYDEEVDIDILLRVGRNECIETYSKILISEIIEKVYIVIEQVVEFIIEKNHLEEYIKFLESIQYEEFKIDYFEFEYCNIFKYNPMNYKINGKRFTNQAFSFILKSENIVEKQDYLITLTISDMIKEYYDFKDKIPQLNEFKRIVYEILNQQKEEKENEVKLEE